jgi:hypothetical protein
MYAQIFYLFLVLSGILIAFGYFVQKKLFIQLGSLFLILAGFHVLVYGLPFFTGWVIG